MASTGGDPALGMPLKQDHASPQEDARRGTAVGIGSDAPQVPSKISFSPFSIHKAKRMILLPLNFSKWAVALQNP